MKKNVVACMRWGNDFPADYVNVLYSAMRKNLTKPFDFVCLTTDAQGFHPDVKVMEIPDMGLPESAWRRGAWPKISILKQELFPNGTKVLFVDLDSMIVGRMDEFLEFESGFHAIGKSTWRSLPASKPKLFWKIKAGLRALKKRGVKNSDSDHSYVDVSEKFDSDKKTIQGNTMGTGIFGYIAGAHTEIYEELVRDVPLALRAFVNEQHFIEHHLDEWTPWRAGAVSSFKYDLRRPILVDIFLRPPSPPVSSPLLAFHGHPRPLDLVTRRVSRSRELPHVWFGPIPWFVEYWTAHNRRD